MQFRIWLTIFSLAAAPIVFAQSTDCSEIEIGKIFFRKNSSRLSKKSKEILETFVNHFKKTENCQMILTGNFADLCNKCGALNWDRIQAIQVYLVRKGMKKERVSAESFLEGNLNFVTIRIIAANLRNIPHPYSGVTDQ